MAVRNVSFTPNRLLQGVYVALVLGAIGLNVLIGRALVESIVLGAWVGTVAAGLVLVAFVFYLSLSVFGTD